MTDLWLVLAIPAGVLSLLLFVIALGWDTPDEDFEDWDDVDPPSA